MSRVVIVNMPFSGLRWPNLGPSLLIAALARRGIACDVAYLNFDFAERIGLERYEWIADRFAFVLGGERLFARHYFGQALPDDDRYWHEVLLPADPKLSAEDRRDFEEILRHVGPFLDHCTAAIDWQEYPVVGFTASLQQTLPSLCLARRIKQLHPQAALMFGGAACEGPMGMALLRQFPVIDYVFLGEADESFPTVVEALLAERPVVLPPGVVARDPTTDRLSPACCEVPAPPEAERSLVRDLDGLPYPDFDDYFRRLESSPLRSRIEPLLFFETARGCWWGEKHQCPFCGLNGGGLSFRSKTPVRAIAELRYLVERYGVRRACAADNVFDPRYFDTLLPALRQANLGLTFAYELKTNLTRPQVDALVAAGLRSAQLGVETFSTPLLRRIGKGANALQNLQALKWFSEAGIEVKWNLLWGFPGEDPADYAALAELLPALCHLAPPAGVGRVRLDRFSPYFQRPTAHGMTNVRPHRAFRHVYPFADEVLARLAYYFEFDYADGRDPASYVGPMVAAAESWQAAQDTVTLRYWDRPDGVLILTDTRPCATRMQWRLGGLQRAVYLFCDTGRSLRAIMASLGATGSDGPALDEPAVGKLLAEWVDARIMLRADDRYLSLALRAPTEKLSE